MTNRIGGDYSAEALEAFRSAYAAQMQTPEDLDVHKETGLPTGEISNTSPWIAHTGLWRYPSGRYPEPVNQPFNPQDHYDSDSEIVEDDELDSDVISDEELDALVDELLGSIGDDEAEYETDEED
jgi:hypothetical protein